MSNKYIGDTMKIKMTNSAEKFRPGDTIVFVENPSVRIDIGKPKGNCTNSNLIGRMGKILYSGGENQFWVALETDNMLVKRQVLVSSSTFKLFDDSLNYIKVNRGDAQDDETPWAPKEKLHVGYVIAKYVVVCDDCVENVATPGVSKHELFTTDIGEYRQTCHECHEVLLEGHPDFPELYPVQKELAHEEFCLIKDNIAVTRNILSNLKQEFDGNGHHDVSDSVKERIDSAFAAIQLTGEIFGLWEKPEKKAEE